MGRRKQELSVEQVEERKRRWWGKERNDKRKQLYRSDPGYREKAKQQARDTYRRTHGVDALPNCRENLPTLAKFGTMRTIEVAGDRPVQPQRGITFTTEEAAHVLGRNQQVLYRWLQSGLFPQPELRARNESNRLQSVYSLAEMRALVDVFGDHQSRTAYYRAEHQETKDRLFAASSAVRSAWGKTYGNATAAAGA